MGKSALDDIKLVFSNLSIPVLIVSESNKVLYCNCAFTELTGYTQLELPDLGTFLIHVFHDSSERVGYSSCILDNISSGSGAKNISCTIADKSGTQKSLLLDINASILENGEKVSLLFFKDITPLRKSDTGEEMSAVRIGQVFENLPVPVMYCDLDDVYRGANKAFREYAGLKTGDIFGRKVSEIFPSGYADVVRRKNRQAVESGGLVTCNSFIPDENGSVPGGEFISTVYYNRNNKPAGVVNAIIEKCCPGNKVGEAAFSQMAVLDRISERVVVHSPDLSILWTNSAAVEGLGIEPKDAVGQKCYELWFNKEKPCENCHSLDAIKSREARWTIKKNRNDKTISLYSYPVFDKNGKLDGVVEISSDYSNLEQIEDKLVWSEQKFKSFFEAINEGIVLVDKNGVITEFNKAMEKITGLKRSDVLDRHFEDFIFDTIPALQPVRNSVMESFEFVMKNGLNPWQKKYYRYEVVDNTGKRKTVFHMPVPVKTGDDMMIGNIIRDVSDFEDTVEDLKYHISLEDAIVAISGIFADEFEPDMNEVLGLLGKSLSVHSAYIFDFAPDYTTMSKTSEWSAEKQFSRKELTQNMSLNEDEWVVEVLEEKESFTIEDVEAPSEYSGRMIDTMRALKVKSVAIVAIKSSDGKISGYLGLSDFKNSRKWTEHDLKMLRIVSRMISNYRNRIAVEKERETLQGHLMHAQKMESIGRLAGGLAHDFNNIITSIMGYSEMLKLKFADIETLEGQASDVILKSAERAQGLTKKLLEFARREVHRPESHDINEIITETVKISSKIFNKNVDIRLDLENDLGDIAIDKGQMEQVITNMLINARDAMPGGGKVTIKTESVRPVNSQADDISGLSYNKYRKITISDTGTGMPDDVLKKIFEPFYTTKGKGVGTGLGLATAYGIIEEHDGHIAVCSEVGKGTRFTIYLPQIETKKEKKSETKTEVLSGDKTILLVDDEEDVRTLGSMMLSSMGYKVIPSVDGIDALEKYVTHQDEIDLVLMDVIMPRMGGGEAFEELKKINPDVKVLLVSGYSKTDTVSFALDNGAVGFLEKPFRRYEISQKVAEALSCHEGCK